MKLTKKWTEKGDARGAWIHQRYFKIRVKISDIPHNRPEG